MITLNRGDFETIRARIRKQEAIEDFGCWAMSAAMLLGAFVIAFAL